MTPPPERHPDIRRRLGLRPIINVSGTMTALGASIVVPDAVRAVTEILPEFVEITDLQRKASAVIARLTGAEAGFVTASASAGITIGVAGCMTGRRSRPHRAAPGRGRHEGRSRHPGRAPRRLRRAGGAGHTARRRPRRDGRPGDRRAPLPARRTGSRSARRPRSTWSRTTRSRTASFPWRASRRSATRAGSRSSPIWRRNTTSAASWPRARTWRSTAPTSSSAARPRASSRAGRISCGRRSSRTPASAGA